MIRLHKFQITCMSVNVQPWMVRGGSDGGGGLQKYLAVIELSSTDSSVAVRGNLGGLLSAVQSYLLSKHF